MMPFKTVPPSNASPKSHYRQNRYMRMTIV